MPYRVAVPSTPIFADANKTLKKGHAVEGQVFICAEEHNGMLRTKRILNADDAFFVIGWVEAKNCERTVEYSTPSIPSTPIYSTSEQEAMDALKTLARFLKAVE